MPRADSGDPHNFTVNFWVFKDDEFESDAKTNSRHRVCLLLFLTFSKLSDQWTPWIINNKILDCCHSQREYTSSSGFVQTQL